MAKSYFSLVLTGLFLLVGCQAQSGQSVVVDSMPAPNFSGPTFHDQDGLFAMTPIPAASPTLVAQPQRHAVIPTSPAHKGHDSVPAEWIPRAKANSWTWIVIHHSATSTGGAAAFDKMHRAKGWDELGYHFVIGNGTDTKDGQIEVGSRWPKQKWGAHTKTPDNQFNEHGIGICLVGNFDVTHPTEAQLKSLSKLVSYMMKTYHIPADHVVGHRDCKSTDCPGRYMNVAAVRKTCVQMLAAAGDKIPQDAAPVLARGEMLHETSRGKSE
ncbi:MAG TPA: peptidoglycan recognition family protein [Tepidisphaeraceae bacterium]|jgi:hypothetical protein|nr:peptidoglycan recognition family protein [Tepidisphaeraceae bacterium]